ncbi:MAG: hypothetical protein ACKVHO_06020 [Verrucomicrobiia bacterium]|jgi:hypothetical protein
MDSRIGRGFSGKKAIEEVLKRLNERLIYADFEPLSLVICGRASRNIMGWVVRSTNDGDILGGLVGGGETESQLVAGDRLSGRFDEVLDWLTKTASGST